MLTDKELEFKPNPHAMNVIDAGKDTGIQNLAEFHVGHYVESFVRASDPNNSASGVIYPIFVFSLTVMRKWR